MHRRCLPHPGLRKGVNSFLVQRLSGPSRALTVTTKPTCHDAPPRSVGGAATVRRHIGDADAARRQTFAGIRSDGETPCGRRAQGRSRCLSRVGVVSSRWPIISRATNAQIDEEDTSVEHAGSPS